MSLSIYYSDKIEELAEHLKGELVKERQAPDADPFSFSTVVVPNTNIAKWLRIRMFGDTPSLCMGIEFPFIENALFGLLAECLPAEDRPKLLPMNAYSIGIMSILLKDGDPALEPFRKYISGDDKGPFSVNSREKARMAWQLSVKLADLMDKYEVHRPEIVTNWLKENRDAEGRPLVTGSIEAAEAALAKKLFGAGGLYPPDNSSGNGLSLRQLFDMVERKAEKPPTPEKTIYFFGLSTLSSLQTRILHWLAKTHTVVFYHNNVCMEYWGDVETKKEEKLSERLLQRLRDAKDADEDIYGKPGDTGKGLDSTLLRQWGRAGRETLRLLVDLEEQNGTGQMPIQFFWEELSPKDGVGEAGTVLSKVQASVRNRMDEVGPVDKQDASLQIVAAPGIRREVEMVYNAILGAVWKPDGSGERPWSDCKFSDIAVLVPDMATYRPVIEAVFDGRGQIPYGLIDTTASEDSTYLRGFLDLMALARDGLSRETLFAVLDNSCVQRALSFGPGDVRSWRRFAKGTGAFDGFEVEEKNKEYRNFSWSEALRRLRLGVVADGEDTLVVWDGGDDGSALKFSAIVETLYRELAPLASDKRECATKPGDRESAKDDETTWYGKLRHVANEFLAVERDDKLEGPVKGQLFGTLSSLYGIEGKQGFDLVVAAVEQFVGGVKCQKGSYLTNGVTIAGLQPMRPVPFKQVFVLGLGEGMFPGRDSATTLEIPGAHRKLGDMQPTEMKKYLFLETLMAVKERLVLSYPCLDPVKDAELFPSGMVCELEKFLGQYVLPKTKAEDGKETATPFQEVKLPLLERGEPDDFSHPDTKDNLLENPVAPIRWADSLHAGLIPTYSNVERRIAREVGKLAKGIASGAKEGTSAPKTEDDRSGAMAERITIRTKELSAFLESPLRATLRYSYGIAVEGYRDDSIDPDAPLELEKQGPDRWGFNEALLEKASDSANVDETVRQLCGDFSIQGKLPEGDGFLGGYAIARLKEKFGDGSALAALRQFACETAHSGFLPGNGTKPNPVRTVLSAATVNGHSLPERLYAGPTKGWVLSEGGRGSSVLLVGKCGDERKKDGSIAETPFPPKAVLEPFVTWVAMVAGEDDGRDYSLRVGIADIDQLLSNVWKWTIKPEEARAYLDTLTDEYLGYLANPDAAGNYLDFGYSDFAKAFIKAKGKAEETGRDVQNFPETIEDWESIGDSFSSDDYYGDKKGFDNSLVIDESVKPFSRLPGNGTDGTAKQDVETMKARYERLLRCPMGGNREWEEVHDGR